MRLRTFVYIVSVPLYFAFLIGCYIVAANLAGLVVIFGVLVVIAFLLLPHRSRRRRLLTPEQQRKSIKVIPPNAQGRYR